MNGTVEEESVTTMNVLAENKTADDQYDQSALEARLDRAVKQREETQAKIKSQQDELERLFIRGPKRQRETTEELDKRMSELERQRTMTSIKISEEREILRQIKRLEKIKRQVVEYEAYDKSIKDKKVIIATLRDTVRELSSSISSMRVELSAVKTANKLGCKVKDLLGMKVECPKDKLGNIIGKKGQHVKQLMQKQNVEVDIDRDDGEVRIIGPLSSLDSAAFDIEKVIERVEETFEISEDLLTYFTSKNITALAGIRHRHPDVNFDVARKNNTQVKVRGCPDDIESLKQDLLDFSISKKVIKVPEQEASVVIGKQGVTVDGLVESFQASINIDRKKEEGVSIITVLGPSSSVAGAVKEIEEMMAENRDVEETVPIHVIAKSVLLMNSGVGIKAIHEKANAETKATSGGPVLVNFGSNTDLVVRGKSKDVRVAIPVVKDEVDRLEGLIVRVPVDPFVMPVIVGKGGSGIKKLREGKMVNVELDRDAGEVSVCGLEREDVDSVVQALYDICEENIIHRIDVDAVTYKAQIRDFLRSKAKELNSLVRLTTEDETNQIILRGSKPNLKTCGEAVREFFTKNFTRELDVTAEDLSALHFGGKQSKIATLANEMEVRLNSDRDRNVVIASGEEAKVANAFTKLKEFLHGGEGIVVSKIMLDDQRIGIVIGKGGKTKAALQKKFDSVSIVVHQNQSHVTLRGPEEDVEECRVEIMKLVLTARVTKTLDITPRQHESLVNARVGRRLNQTVPVAMTTDETTVTLRGLEADVREAVNIVMEHIKGFCECHWEFEESLFRCIKETCKKPSNIKRIEKEAPGTKVSLDESCSRMVFTGKRDKVKIAKQQAMALLKFILGSNMGSIDLQGPSQPSVLKTVTLAEVSAASGASVVLDRDISTIIILSSDPKNVIKAAEQIKPMLEGNQKLSFEIQLTPAEDWLVAAIIGKSGNRVRALRKQTGCKIDVESKARKIMVSGEDEEKVAEARKTLDDIIDSERKQCTYVDIPEQDRPAFVGRAGAHISEFSKKHGVDVQIIKSSTTAVRITGEEEAVSAASKALKEWIESRDATRKEAGANEKVTLRRDQIPAVIGNKGSVIRSLEKEFGCKIDIDRKASVVTVLGGTEEKRSAAIEKIKVIAVGETNDEDDDDDAGDVIPGGHDEQTNGEKPAAKPKPPPGLGASVTRAKAQNAVKRPAAQPPMSQDFPTLQKASSDDDEDTADEHKNGSLPDNETINGPSWASVVTVHPSQNDMAPQEIPDDGITLMMDGYPDEPELNLSSYLDGGRRTLLFDDNKSIVSDDGMAEELAALNEITAQVKASLDATW